MRSSISPPAASAVFAIMVLISVAARAETAAEPPVICAALTVAAPAQLIESCTALIDSPTTPEADRLDARITRAVALHGSGQTDKALAEIDAVIARDPNRARAFRARGEILRQTGKREAAFEALNQAIRLEPDNANGFESRGNAFNNAGKYDRAIEDYNERFPTAAPPGISRASIRRRSPITTRRSASNRTGRGPTPTGPRPIASSAAQSARSRTIVLRSGLIRHSRNSSIIAGCIWPAMAITPAQSPITTKRSKFIPNQNS